MCKTALVSRVKRLLPVPADFIEGIQRAALAGEDVFGRLGPGEGLRAGVMLQEVVVDVIASHAPTLTRKAAPWNPPSGAEH